MKKSAIVALAAAFVVSMAAPALAAGNKTGFGSNSSSTSTQGSGGKTNTSANPNNQGQTTVTTETSGPKGQLKQGTTCNNCTTTTTVNLPGNGR